MMSRDSFKPKLLYDRQFRSSFNSHSDLSQGQLDPTEESVATCCLK